MKIVDIDKIVDFLKNNCDERDVITPEAVIMMLDAGQASPWTSGDVIPANRDRDNGFVAVVNGQSGTNVFFEDAIIIAGYDEDEGWYSENYDISDCEVRCYMPVPDFDYMPMPRHPAKKKDIIKELEQLLEDFSEEGRSNVCRVLKDTIDALSEKGIGAK